MIEDCVFNDIQNNKDILLFKANDKKKIASALSEDWICFFQRERTRTHTHTHIHTYKSKSVHVALDVADTADFCVMMV